MKKSLKPRAMWVVVGMVLVAATAVTVFEVFAPLDSNVEADRQMRTTAVLNGMGRSLDAWVAEHGRAPSAAEAWSVLEAPQVSVKDGWGRRLIYISERGRNGRVFQLRSMGPNAQDDGGDADDMSYPPDARQN